MYHSERPEIQRLFTKRVSLATRVFKPVANFMFCTIALLYTLIHPSVILLFLLPLLIMSFFLGRASQRWISIVSLIIVSGFILIQEGIILAEWSITTS